MPSSLQPSNFLSTAVRLYCLTEPLPIRTKCSLSFSLACLRLVSACVVSNQRRVWSDRCFFETRDSHHNAILGFLLFPSIHTNHPKIHYHSCIVLFHLSLSFGVFQLCFFKSVNLPVLGDHKSCNCIVYEQYFLICYCVNDPRIDFVLRKCASVPTNNLAVVKLSAAPSITSALVVKTYQ